MQQRQLGFSRIAQRLRWILLTIAVLVSVLPIYVYFATNEVVAEQNAVSQKLLGATFRSERLNTEVARIADEGRNLQLQTDINILRQRSRTLVQDIDALGDASNEDEAPLVYSIVLSDDLARYKARVSEATDAKIIELEAAKLRRDNVVKFRTISNDMLALLGAEIAARKVELDRRIGLLNDTRDAENLALTRETFNSLITLNSIVDALATERLLLLVTNQDPETPLMQTQRTRVQLQMRNLATLIAKLRPGDTQTSMAKHAISLNSVVFGNEGLFAQVERQEIAKIRVSEIVAEQQVLANRMLVSTQAVVNAAQLDVLASANAANVLLKRIRVYVIVVTTLVAGLVVGAILFVVERQFNRRISGLTDRVVAIAEGKDDTGEPITGNDELSAMGDALTVFKRNASELREANQLLGSRNYQIRQLSDRLETILDTTTSGIVAFDDAGQIVLANLPARHFLGGVSLQAPFERPDSLRFLNREDLSPLDASSDPINRVIAGQMLNNEIALMERAGGGDGRYVRITSNRVANPESLVRTVLAIDDVSVAEQNRQQIERASRLDALGQLTGGIAHDFNNLLATIQYAVQLSADAENQASKERFTRIALESVDRGSKLSNRLLSFAKRQPGISKSHNVEKVLEDFETLIGPTIEKLITLDFKIDEPDMSVFCDAAQLENALLNLVLNARDAILRGGSGDKVTVAVRGVSEINTAASVSDGDPNRYLTDSLEMELRKQSEQDHGTAYRYVEFSVTDNGPGMTEEVKRRALDPFFTTKSTNSGTGLGLSMVYGFVQQSGGELRIYSELDRGTTMRLLLPRGSIQGQREEPIARQLPMAGDGQRILIVEDEAHLLEAMHALIDSLGYEIYTAISGNAALAMIEGGLEIDLLLTDIVMPGSIGGFDLAAKLRDRIPNLPIIYMSGYAAYSVREMGVVVAPLLQKPCAPRELAEHLRNALAANA